MSSYTLGAGVPFQGPRKAVRGVCNLDTGKEISANLLKPVLLLIELFRKTTAYRIVPFSSSHERGFLLFHVGAVSNRASTVWEGTDTIIHCVVKKLLPAVGFVVQLAVSP